MNHPEEKLPAISTIRTNEHGRFLPASFEDSYRLAKMYVESGMLPDRYKHPAAVLTAQQYAAELGITGISALRQIAIIKGTPALFGDLPLAVIRSKGLLEFIDEYLMTKAGVRISVENKNLHEEFYAAVCVLQRKGEKARTFTFTVDDAKTAGLWGQNVWRPYPKRMITFRTRGMGTKDVFGDALAGIAIGEYDLNTIMENVDNEVISSGPLGAGAGAAKLNGLAAVPTETAEVLPPEPKATRGKAKMGEPLNVTATASTVASPAPASTAPAPSAAEPGSFQDFAQSSVPLAQPKTLPSKDELLGQVTTLIAQIPIGLDELTAKCMAEFSKPCDALTAEEVQVLIMVLKRELAKKPAKGKTA